MPFEATIRVQGGQERRRAMNAIVVEGDLLDQPVNVIVNTWNRNVIPWGLLLPQGGSGAIKKRGGTGPFRAVRGGPGHGWMRDYLVRVGRGTPYGESGGMFSWPAAALRPC